MNHRDMHPSLGRLKECFIVFAQAAVPTQPSQRSFNYPPFGKHLKLMAVSRTFNDLQHPARMGLHPVNQLPSVSGIAPDQLEPRKLPYQFLQDQLGPISVLDISRMDHDSRQQSYGVYDDMPFASLDLLARVIAARPPFPWSSPTGCR